LYCLKNKTSVAVEKPICLSFEQYKTLVGYALNNNLVLFPLLAFSSHPSIQQLALTLASIKITECVRIYITWKDLIGDTRYGETVAHDPNLPSHQDVLPHITSILHVLFPGSPIVEASMSSLDHEGASLIRLTSARFSASLALNQSADIRERSILIESDSFSFLLEFTAEPGKLAIRSSQYRSLIALPSWEPENSPLSQQLLHFIKLTQAVDPSSSAENPSVSDYYSILSLLQT
jgi:predicted dehydrogenase